MQRAQFHLLELPALAPGDCLFVPRCISLSKSSQGKRVISNNSARMMSFKAQAVKTTCAKTKAAPAKQDVDNSDNGKEEPESILVKVIQADDTKENGKDESVQEKSKDASNAKIAPNKTLHDN